MKKILNLWLMAALVCGLSMSVTSCKDDDINDGSDSGSPEEQLAEQSNEFWAVAGQLVGTTNATSDYADKTFEPIIGEPLPGNATVRRVVVNTLESAAERFESLVGLDEGTVNASTDSYTWKSDAVGTLTYTKSSDGTSLATVDVSIKQVPGLRQIEFLTPEQMGTNAAEDNWRNCYYRFGDVISRKTSEGITEYWVCVRPSFDPEGKKKSHWATLSPLPAKNIAVYGKASNGKMYSMPTNLGQDDKQMENLAEMLFAIYDPVKWEQNIADNAGGMFSSGIEIFQDFDRNKIQFTSSDFWERVQKGWKETKVGDAEDLWDAVLGQPQKTFEQDFESYGLHLLYYGYKWKWSLFNDLTLYEQVFTTKGDGKKSNMHNMRKRTINHDVIYKNHPERDIVVNVAAQYTEKHPYLDNTSLHSQDGTQEFFGSDDPAPHFIFRFATGDELAKESGAAYDKKTKMSGFEDVYVYNQKYQKDVNAKCETRSEIQNGKPDPDDGKAHTIKDIGLEFDGSRMFDIYSALDDEFVLDVSCSWKNGAQKRNMTLYAFAENNLTGDKTPLGTFEINTWSNFNDINPVVNGLATGDYTLLVTESSQGKDPCVFTKTFSIANPQFTVEWKGVESQMQPSKEVREGRVALTIQNFDNLRINYLYLIVKDVTANKSDIRRTYNFMDFEKNKAHELDFTYVIDQQHDYSLILTADDENKKVVAQMNVKGVVTSKSMNEVTAADLYSILGGDGRVYPTIDAANAAGSYALAMIVLTPWQNEEDNMKVNFCDDKDSPYYDTAKTAKEIEDALGLIHAMAIPMTAPREDIPEGLEFDPRDYDDAMSSLNRWNVYGQSDMYLKGHNWQLPSAYLVTRMMNESLSHSVLSRQDMDSPNLYSWKGLKLIDPDTRYEASNKNYCRIPAYNYFLQNIAMKSDEVHAPKNLWIKEVVEFKGTKYPMALHYDMSYPSANDRKSTFYYLPTDKKKEMGFMPVILW